MRATICHSHLASNTPPQPYTAQSDQSRRTYETPTNALPTRLAHLRAGVLAVHLWSTVSPLSPAERVLCAKQLGFWTLAPSQPPVALPAASLPASSLPAASLPAAPLPAASLRVAPILSKDEGRLPSERVLYRQALHHLLDRLRRERARRLDSYGLVRRAPLTVFYPNKGGRSGAQEGAGGRGVGAAGGEAGHGGLSDEAEARAAFTPVQARGVGYWPNGMELGTHIPRLPRGSAGALNYSAAGGKCAAGMFVFGRAEDAAADRTVLDPARPPPRELLSGTSKHG